MKEKKVYKSFQEMLRCIRGKVEEITPKEYIEQPEEKPKKKKKKEGD